MVSFSSLLAVLLALNFASQGDGLIRELERDLIEEGFEGVSLALDGDNLIVTYENRIYRHEIRAIEEIMATLLPLLEEGINVTLIPQNRGVPLFAIIIPADMGEALSDRAISHDADSVWGVLRDFLDGGDDEEAGIQVSLDLTGWKPVLPDSDTVWQRAKDTGVFFQRFGIALHPQFRAEYGNGDNTIRSQINVVPEVNASFWKGMLVSAQLVIPIQNELEDDGDYLRPGLLTLNQTLRLPRNAFVSATVGHFTHRRYGADLELRKYFASGRWSAGANTGYTGYAAYIDGVWFYSRPGRVTALFDVNYQFSRFDLGVRLTFGNFLYGDKGVRLDVSRQLGEGCLGFYADKTEGGENVGFNFCVPIFPSRHLSIGTVRIGPAREFWQEYRYSGFLSEGVQYDTGNSIDEFVKRLNPGYIRNQMAGFRDGR